MSWNVAEYERFSAERARPFFDLVSRIPNAAIRSVVDLGCGTGELTRALAERWPGAVVLGLDNSPEMLTAARPRAIPGRLQFEPGDAGRFHPAAPVDCLVANAVLQWLPDHDTLIPALAAMLAPDGTLAVQMPANFDAPSHTLLRTVASNGPWADRLRATLRAEPVQPLPVYTDLLLRLGLHVEAWETTYHHLLDGEDAVLNWVRGTALRPVLGVLEPSERADFEARYGAALRAAYPRTAHGTWFPFRRIFFVARRVSR